MPTISVIIPVYKAEKYLARCIDSVLGQSFQDIEIILVDDGSPDACPAICDSYADKDDRIKVIHKQNQGVSVARNTGLDCAKGEFVFFCDSDDMIPKNALEDLYNAIVSDFDLAVGYFEWIESYETRNFRNVRLINKLSRIEIRSDFKNKFTDTWRAVNFLSCCGKLFRKSILDKYKIRLQPDLVTFEDFDFVLNYLEKIDSLVVADKYSYSVFSEKNDAPHYLNRSRLDYVDDYIRGDNRLKEFLKKHDIPYEDCYWRSIRANLQIAYDALWAMPEDTKEQKRKKYRRISEVLKLPQFQYKTEYEEASVSRLEYHLLKKGNAKRLARYYRFVAWMKKYFI